ncbi:MAG: UBP-type zinc finger domain-containing protein [Gemmatimonadetes bacterium]|nr:UBP-type zinc finger domain-containing protein [Gemmatimonadota bacterium]
MKRHDCPHHGSTETASPQTDRCQECGAERSLRVCATCGHVGCCESQQSHDTQHWRATGHPIIRSLPLTEHSFTWCYECHDYLG